MSGFEFTAGAQTLGQPHVFLGEGHERNECRTWAVIWVCTAMMVLEIVGGLWFGSIALVADGLHMSTHAGALLLAALAYTFARRHAQDPRFSFGTGKLGDLAGFTSAIILGVVAVGIGAEAVRRFFSPVQIHFNEAIPIAVLGLGVNLLSAWLLGAGHHHHGHHDHDHDDHHDHDHDHDHMHHQDNNMRAAMVHVMADAAVSVAVIIGLVLAKLFGWLWMDPLAGILGAVVIASWAVTLVRDTGAILLDMTPDARMAQALRTLVKEEGDQLTDFHLWRLGPGHLGAILSVQTASSRDAQYYRARLEEFSTLSHVTIEVQRSA
ncbi:MAG TPA: CDF family Co(II)/Ni(II) efflux transporter DmeF [Acidocella sp.]|nr:CDF family Co(II)/Ni(II) efflux transporter DmeF [Acidocella sp.]